MKTYLKKTALFSFLAVGLMLFSCSNDDDSQDNQEVNFSAENTARAAQTDNIVEGSFNVMEAAYVETEEGRSNNISFFPSCAEIVINPSGNGGTITITFSEGCQLNNGAVVSGGIFIEYGPFEAGSRIIEYTYQDFTYNNNNVAGGGEVIRQIANQNGNPQSSATETITVSFPGTSVTATREGNRIIEWVEGVGSGTWVDNVYEINGSWNTEFSNGFTRSGEVTTTLVKKLSCIYLVSGVLEIQQEGFTGTIDWGDGECDNQATLIINGQEFPIIL
ncbi:MAG: hypothetical protein KJO39_08775 [Bacteroidia bacterium]|nr:hypothetical protein [Bacteroidia bacterium]NNF31794.1 hypothetical protein [Flavobacteriaceae bacterium]NNJ83042.1 hypothetical protein [Flavobacteriaceae bacterium]NNK53367.1 hypothetical protein [Flavobacteriaceae bacterium]